MKIDVDAKTGQRLIKLSQREVQWLRAADVVMRQLKQLEIKGDLATIVSKMKDGVVQDGSVAEVHSSEDSQTGITEQRSRDEN